MKEGIRIDLDSNDIKGVFEDTYSGPVVKYDCSYFDPTKVFTFSKEIAETSVRLIKHFIFENECLFDCYHHGDKMINDIDLT